MKRGITLLAGTLVVSAGMLFSGCSSSPSDEELATLKNLEDQVTSLDSQVKDATAANASLQKQIADKNGKIQQCQSDQDAVKKAMGGK